MGPVPRTSDDADEKAKHFGQEWGHTDGNIYIMVRPTWTVTGALWDTVQDVSQEDRVLAFINNYSDLGGKLK